MSATVTPSISLIIPVFNRPEEVKELLKSFEEQTFHDVELIFVEDGSNEKCDHIVNQYTERFNVKYFFKDNSGPGQTRNYGCEKATGNYFIFLDSDCVLPPHYCETVQRELTENFVDAFGGPDAAHDDFTDLQKAINYSMTSFFTTGGIRGGSEKVDKFHPRSFNMGYSKEVYETTKGFAKMRFGEDIDMSLRILSNGFKTRLLKDAFVYHKRRSTLKQFYKQVYNSGIARINLFKRHPSSLKIVHTAPAVFTIGCISLILPSSLLSGFFAFPIYLFCWLVLIDSTIKNKSLKIGLMSIVTSFVQLFGYGLGFIKATFKRIILGQDEFAAFNKNFYK